MIRTTRTARAATWAALALEHLAAGRPDDAEICAYEAGRCGGAPPVAIEGHPALCEAFALGTVDARNDAEGDERAAAYSAFAADDLAWYEEI